MMEMALWRNRTVQLCIAKDQELPLIYGKGDIRQGFFFHLGIGKAHIFEYIVFHFLSSVKFSTTGVMQSPKYTA